MIELSDNVKLSGLRFQHYKNKKFYDHIAEAKWMGSFERPNRKFVFEAKHTETGQVLKSYLERDNYEYLYEHDLGELTIYRADYYDPTYGYNMIWARPADMFWGDVEVEDGEVTPRFRLVTNEEESK